MNTAARYTHDCSGCTYLGQHGDYDLYVHRAGNTNLFVARFGGEHNEVVGVAGATHPALVEAQRLAGERKS